MPHACKPFEPCRVAQQICCQDVWMQRFPSLRLPNQLHPVAMHPSIPAAVGEKKKKTAPQACDTGGSRRDGWTPPNNAHLTKVAFVQQEKCQISPSWACWSPTSHPGTSDRRQPFQAAVNKCEGCGWDMRWGRQIILPRPFTLFCPTVQYPCPGREPRLLCN